MLTPFVVYALAVKALAGDQRVLMQSGTADPSWTIQVRSSWDVLGPFPVRAREQHLFFPAFPLQQSEIARPFERKDNASWSSSLADGGSVRWSTAIQDDAGHLSVSFPEVRWASLRAIEGWAVLQHHALLHTTFTVSAPTQRSIETRHPHLLVSSVQNSFFAILPQDRNESYIADWHASNIYAYPHAPKQAISLPHLKSEGDTTFDVYMSADYEIRLFGDPHNTGREVPVIEIDFNLQLEQEDGFITRDTNLDVNPDFVDGFAFGEVFGFGLRSLSSHDTWQIISARILDDAYVGLVVSTTQSDNKFRLKPLQSRVYVVRIEQEREFDGKELSIEIDLCKYGKEAESEARRTLRLSIPVTHRDSASFTSTERSIIHATHFLAGTAVKFLTVPPVHESTALPILYLHGAGVEIDNPELPVSLPRQSASWIMYPSGRTSWGYDWHGPSARHALSVAPALHHILSTHPTFSARPKFAPDSRVVLVGHSNGGQGTWFNAARNPDRVAAMMAAAAYSKSQSYVSWAMERGAHYSDPVLNMVLKASMTGDDNDLFLSNIVGKPVLGLHGGADENVPTWHTRELVSVLHTLSPNASQDVKFVEMPGRPHWYPGYFDSVPEAQKFLDAAVLLSEDSPLAPVGEGRAWTLTVAWPHESGSLYGFKVLELEVPGKLARLTVEMPNIYSVIVKSSNVLRFSFPITHPFASGTGGTITIDRTTIPYKTLSKQLRGETVTLQKTSIGSWEVFTEDASFTSSRVPGPMSHALDTSSTIKIVVPDTPSDSKCLSVATRLAHVLLAYLALDVEILSASEAASQSPHVSAGTTIILSAGTDEHNSYGAILQGSAPFRIENGKIYIGGYVLDEPSIGALFAHTVPGSQDHVVYISGTDASGLEQAVRLFPFRTGVPVPEWIVVSGLADARATGGILGAGFWDRSGFIRDELKPLLWTAW